MSVKIFEMWIARCIAIVVTFRLPDIELHLLYCLFIGLWIIDSMKELYISSKFMFVIFRNKNIQSMEMHVTNSNRYLK
jgi:hypothetical protein